ncbi:glutamate--tRNA ligase [Mycoplasmoides pneumoniae]|uniref:glutamate--tRNA ligase n=1 Tax=Mycoplasmoides pneumoniae TaxID=2104 RepID=UPI00132F93DB|nr:glutamate--tRNA ligase [Mycoplasmoides pneumoniae]
MEKIRTRYAPSPTGYLHVGGARTAIFNFLLAKHFNGEFIIRIEDTDTERNVEGGIESQLENLRWLGIIPDESIYNPGNYGPYIQSQKLATYKKLAYELVDKGLAYRCFCTKEKLEHERQLALEHHQTPKYLGTCRNLHSKHIQTNLDNQVPFTIRLKINQDAEFAWNDQVRGKITIPGNSLTDIVLLKANGIATYNFAVVIDDHDMEITDVLRGAEHISNTAYQLAINQALGYQRIPRFGHLSVIVDKSGKKLSKRDTKTIQFIEQFKQEGYLPEAVVNFLALLGWNSDFNREFFTINQLIESFTVNRVVGAPAFFDIKKLQWINAHYIKELSDNAYFNFIDNYLTIDFDYLKNKRKEVSLLFKNQLAFGIEINQLIKETFAPKLGVQHLSVKHRELFKELQSALQQLSEQLQALPDWTKDNVKSTLTQIGEQFNLKGKKLFMPLRLIFTNKEHGPDLAGIMVLHGKTQVLALLQEFIHATNLF